jgi:hypothetical protein
MNRMTEKEKTELAAKALAKAKVLTAAERDDVLFLVSLPFGVRRFLWLAAMEKQDENMLVLLSIAQAVILKSIELTG